jgi:D-galactarolactone cycloisomerase
VSLAKKLGGPVSTSLPTYASGPFLKVGENPYRDVVEEIATYLERGFNGVKLRLGRDIVSDISTVEAVRDRFGDLPLMVDFNQGLSRRNAEAAIKALSSYGILFIEEPLPADDLDGYVELSQASNIPIAAGESLVGITRFKDFISRGAIKIAQPDVAHCGGITEYLRILALGEAFNIDVVPHVWSTAVVHAASLQLAALTPSRGDYVMPAPFFEVDPTPNALLDLAGPLSLSTNGKIEVPTGPGIGLELFEQRLRPFTQSHKSS